MNKNIIIICIIILFNQESYSQPIIINGKVNNVESGKIFLISSWNSKIYMTKNQIIDSSLIVDGSFEFKITLFDSIVYPYYFIIETDSFNNRTGIVFFEHKNQFVEIDTIDPHIAPKVLNSLYQIELKGQYEILFKNIIDRSIQFNEIIESVNDSEPMNADIQLNNKKIREKIINDGDSLLFKYSNEHKNSFISFWKLNERLENNSYKLIYENIFNLFSNEIKSSKNGIILLNEILKSKKSAINYQFPDLELKTLNKKVYQLRNYGIKSSYTLINFWFSKCIPCISHIPEISSINSLYPKSYFQIIGIAIDSRDDFEYLKKVIKNKKINWKNYWDEDGIVTNELGINSFPSNILLNQSGLIVQKNIAFDDLTLFLNEKFKKTIFFFSNYEPD
jgi:thiol-disulfide isomerase/thioredoxin